MALDWFLHSNDSRKLKMQFAADQYLYFTQPG